MHGVLRVCGHHLPLSLGSRRTVATEGLHGTPESRVSRSLGPQSEVLTAGGPRGASDQELLNELASLRFIEAGQHVVMVGPVGVGKTVLAHAIGHIACRRQYSVITTSADAMLKNLRHARLDHSYEAEMRRLLAVDLLLIDDRFTNNAYDLSNPAKAPARAEGARWTGRPGLIQSRLVTRG